MTTRYPINTHGLRVLRLVVFISLPPPAMSWFTSYIDYKPEPTAVSDNPAQIMATFCGRRCVDGRLDVTENYCSIPACFPCDCGPNCALTGTCCPKVTKNESGVERVIFDFGEEDEMEGYFHGIYARNKCQEPVAASDTGKILMVSSCPHNWTVTESGKNVTEKCENPKDDSFLSVTPYVDKESGLTFANVFCAQCNGLIPEDQNDWNIDTGFYDVTSTTPDWTDENTSNSHQWKTTPTTENENNTNVELLITTPTSNSNQSETTHTLFNTENVTKSAFNTVNKTTPTHNTNQWTTSTVSQTDGWETTPTSYTESKTMHTSTPDQWRTAHTSTSTPSSNTDQWETTSVTSSLMTDFGSRDSNHTFPSTSTHVTNSQTPNTDMRSDVSTHMTQSVTSMTTPPGGQRVSTPHTELHSSTHLLNHVSLPIHMTSSISNTPPDQKTAPSGSGHHSGTSSSWFDVTSSHTRPVGEVTNHVTDGNVELISKTVTGHHGEGGETTNIHTTDSNTGTLHTTFETHTTQKTTQQPLTPHLVSPSGHHLGISSTTKTTTGLNDVFPTDNHHVTTSAATSDGHFDPDVTAAGPSTRVSNTGQPNIGTGPTTELPQSPDSNQHNESPDAGTNAGTGSRRKRSLPVTGSPDKLGKPKTNPGELVVISGSGSSSLNRISTGLEGTQKPGGEATIFVSLHSNGSSTTNGHNSDGSIPPDGGPLPLSRRPPNDDDNDDGPRSTEPSARPDWEPAVGNGSDMSIKPLPVPGGSADFHNPALQTMSPVPEFSVPRVIRHHTGNDTVSLVRVALMVGCDDYQNLIHITDAFQFYQLAKQLDECVVQLSPSKDLGGTFTKCPQAFEEPRVTSMTPKCNKRTKEPFAAACHANPLRPGMQVAGHKNLFCQMCSKRNLNLMYKNNCLEIEATPPPVMIDMHRQDEIIKTNTYLGVTCQGVQCANETDKCPPGKVIFKDNSQRTCRQAIGVYGGLTYSLHARFRLSMYSRQEHPNQFFLQIVSTIVNDSLPIRGSQLTIKFDECNPYDIIRHTYSIEVDVKGTVSATWDFSRDEFEMKVLEGLRNMYVSETQGDDGRKGPTGSSSSISMNDTDTERSSGEGDDMGTADIDSDSDQPETGDPTVGLSVALFPLDLVCLGKETCTLYRHRTAKSGTCKPLKKWSNVDESLQKSGIHNLTGLLDINGLMNCPATSFPVNGKVELSDGFLRFKMSGNVLGWDDRKVFSVGKIKICEDDIHTISIYGNFHMPGDSGGEGVGKNPNMNSTDTAIGTTGKSRPPATGQELSFKTGQPDTTINPGTGFGFHGLVGDNMNMSMHNKSSRDTGIEGDNWNMNMSIMSMHNESTSGTGMDAGLVGDINMNMNMSMHNESSSNNANASGYRTNGDLNNTASARALGIGRPIVLLTVLIINVMRAVIFRVF